MFITEALKDTAELFEALILEAKKGKKPLKGKAKDKPKSKSKAKPKSKREKLKKAVKTMKVKRSAGSSKRVTKGTGGGKDYKYVKNTKKEQEKADASDAKRFGKQSEKYTRHGAPNNVGKARPKHMAKNDATGKTGGKKYAGYKERLMKKDGGPAKNPFQRFSKLGVKSPGKKARDAKGEWDCENSGPYVSKCKNLKTGKVKTIKIKRGWKKRYNKDYAAGHKTGRYVAGSRSGNNTPGRGTGGAAHRMPADK